VSQVLVVMFLTQREWEHMYIVSSRERSTFNTLLLSGDYSELVAVAGIGGALFVKEVEAHDIHAEFGQREEGVGSIAAAHIQVYCVV